IRIRPGQPVRGHLQRKPGGCGTDIGIGLVELGEQLLGRYFGASCAGMAEDHRDSDRADYGPRPHGSPPDLAPAAHAATLGTTAREDNPPEWRAEAGHTSAG